MRGAAWAGGPSWASSTEGAASATWTSAGAGSLAATSTAGSPGSTVVGAVSPGAIILMHDAGGTDRQQTIAALPGVIDGLQAAGYTLLPLPPDPAG